MRSAIATSEFSTNFPSAERVSGIVSFGSQAMPSVCGRLTPSGNLESQNMCAGSAGLAEFAQAVRKNRSVEEPAPLCATEFPQHRLHVLYVSVCDRLAVGWCSAASDT